MQLPRNAGAGDDWLASEGAGASADDDWLASEGVSARAGVGID